MPTHWQTNAHWLQQTKLFLLLTVDEFGQFLGRGTVTEILWMASGFNGKPDPTPTGHFLWDRDSELASFGWIHHQKYWHTAWKPAVSIQSREDPGHGSQPLDKRLRRYEQWSRIRILIWIRAPQPPPIRPSSNRGKTAFPHCNISFQTAGPVSEDRYRVRSYPLFCNSIITKYYSIVFRSPVESMKQRLPTAMRSEGSMHCLMMQTKEQGVYIVELLDALLKYSHL